MQRWEYRVVTLREGHYTQKLNEYAGEGWELVHVAPDVRSVSAGEPGATASMPGAFGRLEDAASRLSKLGEGEPADTAALTTWTTLVWVLRRPLFEDGE